MQPSADISKEPQARCLRFFFLRARLRMRLWARGKEGQLVAVGKRIAGRGAGRPGRRIGRERCRTEAENVGEEERRWAGKRRWAEPRQG